MKKMLDVFLGWVGWVLIYTFTSLFFGGCRSNSSVIDTDENVTKNTVKNDTGKQSVSEEIYTMMERYFRKFTTELNDLTVKVESTTYYPADSTGRQSKKEQTTTSIIDRGKTDTRTEDSTSTIMSAVLQKLTQIERKLDEKNTSKTVTQVEEKKGITWLQAALIWLGLTTLIYIGYRIYMKLKRP